MKIKGVKMKIKGVKMKIKGDGIYLRVPLIWYTKNSDEKGVKL